MLWNPTRSGSGVTIVDSFEDQDLAEYTGASTSDSGKSIVTSPVLDGTYALELTSFESGMYSVPGDGLNAYPTKGDVFNLIQQTTGSVNGRWRLYFGLETGTDETYEVEFDLDNSTFSLNSVVGGSRSTLVSATSVPYATGTWYAGRVTWDDGTLGGSDNDITVELVEDPTGSATVLETLGPVSNSDHATGDGVGLNAANYNANAVVVDYWHIE
jgi:hypothetical protein